MHQHKGIANSKRLSVNFENICDWFVNNKLSIHFDDDKTKSLFFVSKRRAKNFCTINIRYKEINIKK